MSQIKNISGFPEWLPEGRLVEEGLIARIRDIFRSFGFTPIETPAVELRDTLTSKGVVDKEIYLLKRASAEGGGDEDLALHFDLTVPFARYVGQHYNDLQFPFKRYQLQKVWRGERPQKGRFREFYQFDVDIIAREVLPLAADGEIITILDKAFSAINIARHQVRINNRKILFGLYDSLGLSVEHQIEAIRIVDKLDKIGKEGVGKELSQLNLDPKTVEAILSYTEVRGPIADCVTRLGAFDVSAPQFVEGCKELESVSSAMSKDTRSRCQFDLSLARGLDYYTGTIFEISLPDHAEFGTVSSGGRYENLTSQFINKKLPGVGGSIGLSRLMDLILKNQLLPVTEKTPAKVMITVLSESQREECLAHAETLRGCGVPAEVYLSSPKLGRQIEYADSKGIPFVLFVGEGTLEGKNLKTKEQLPINNLQDWAVNTVLTYRA